MSYHQRPPRHVRPSEWKAMLDAGPEQPKNARKLNNSEVAVLRHLKEAIQGTIGGMSAHLPGGKDRWMHKMVITLNNLFERGYVTLLRDDWVRITDAGREGIDLHDHAAPDELPPQP